MQTRVAPLRTILVVTLLLVGACSHLTSHEIGDPTASVERLRAGGGIEAEVEHLVRPVIESGETLGIMVGVLTPDGAIHLHGYGIVDRKNREVPEADTIFPVGSLTKCLVVSLMSVLEDKGMLAFDDTIGEILPASLNLSDDVAAITLLELATHRSGLGWERNSPRLMWNCLLYTVTGDDPFGHVDLESVYDQLGDSAGDLDQEKAYAYSNIGAGLLGHLIEIRTGRSLPDLLRQHICGPLGMRDTTFSLSAEQKERRATGHSGDQPLFIPRHRPLADWPMTGVMKHAGGLRSTARDILIFLRENLGFEDTRLGRTLAMNHRVRFETEHESVATGWYVADLEGGAVRVAYQYGVVSGFTAYMGIEPRSRVGVVVLCNNFNWVDRIGHALVVRLTRGLGGGGP